MTTEELAGCPDVAKQTANRWIRGKGWRTERFPDVKDGRARPILVDTRVYESIQSTPAFRNAPMPLEVEEPLAEYAPSIRTPAYRQIISAIDSMTHSEQKKLRNFYHAKEFVIFLLVST